MNLDDLLEEGIFFDPHYLPSMNSDHLPMTLCAMKGLGANDVQLQDFQGQYRQRLRPVSSNPLSGDWRGAVGNPDAYFGMMLYLRSEIDQRGIAEVVAEFLPEFVPGIALQAFHPIIRLGYAIDFQSAAETSAGLAYLITSYREVPFDPQEIIDLESMLEHQAGNGPQQFRHERFSQRIIELVSKDEFPTGTAPFAACAKSALDIYRSTRDFFALHMVTATQAARICAQLVDPQQVRSCLTGAILAAHKAVGSPSKGVFQPLSHSLEPEHSLKYAWACLSEFEAYGDPRYLEEVKALQENDLIPPWCAQAYNL